MWNNTKKKLFMLLEKFIFVKVICSISITYTCNYLYSKESESESEHIRMSEHIRISAREFTYTD